MTTFAEHAALFQQTKSQAAIPSKEIRSRMADALSSTYDVPVYPAPQTAMELPCGMIFAGGGRNYREQKGFESQTIRYAVVFMTTGDDEDVADWFDDILDTIASTLLGIDVGAGTGALTVNAILEPTEASTGSTEVWALRIEVSTIRSTC